MIKRRLATLAPQMKIFLDVDDLEVPSHAVSPI